MGFRIEIDRADGTTEVFHTHTMRLAYQTARRAARNGAFWAGIFSAGTSALWTYFEAD